MPMATERSNALHNFTLPTELRWGNQKFLRCMKVNSDGQISSQRRFSANSSDQRHRGNCTQQLRTGRDRENRQKEKESSSSEFINRSRRRGAESVGSRKFRDDGVEIAAVREKMLLDLQTAADKMKDAIFREGLEEGEISSSPPNSAAATVEGETQKPWNLRTRRATCKTPAIRCASTVNGAVAATSHNDSVGEGLKFDFLKPNSGSSLRKSTTTAVATEKSSRLRIGGNTPASVGDKRDREKFCVALQKSEIEEDFAEMVGHRPPRRPKKRAKTVQRQLDTLFPGLWLTEVTADMYEVSEVPQ